MLNIVVINCDDEYMEYEWKSKDAFIKDMESENENIPMLDDVLASVDTDDERLHYWWRETGCFTVNDLYEKCKRGCFRKI